MDSAPPDKTRLQATRDRLDRLSWWLDQSFRIPGTRFRFGLDALIGLVPFAGDAAGLGLSLWVMREAHQCGAPRPLLWRMGGNAVADALAGFVPVVGDIFDFFFKANRRNADLLRQHLDLQLRPVPRHTRLMRLAILLILLGIVGGWIYFSYLQT